MYKKRNRQKVTYLPGIIVALFLLFFSLCPNGVLAEDEGEKLDGKKVDINTATVEEFLQVPLMTKELAEKIVEYRDEMGDFQVIEELLQVEGFTRELLRKIKDFLLIEGIGEDDCTC